MLEKLNDMIKDRYGKGFSIRKLAAVEAEASTEMVIRGDDLYVPIYVKDIFLGFGMVHEARDLTLEQQKHVSKLIRMIMEPELYSQHLERTINNLEIEKTSVTDTDEEDHKKLIFVFGQQPTRVQKISMEIHEVSNNWSLLPIQDISSQLKSATDIVALNGSTLSVNLELGLNTELESVILEYLKQDLSGALLIFSAARPSYQLLEAKLISAEMHSHLMKHEFSVDRLPIEKNMLKDVLEMMYFSS